MLKLKRYVRPYLGLLAMGVALLFGQAMLELTLPNYMSDIVNVGVQQGGITQAAPEAIDNASMSMIMGFMSEQDRQIVQQTYREAGQQDMTELQKKYPNLSSEDYVLTQQPENGVNEAFERAAYAMINVLPQVDKNAEKADLEQISLMMQTPEMRQKIEDSIQLAGVTPESMLKQTGAVFAKRFYTQLGADTDAIQIHYILKVGLRMAILAVLLTSCAVAAGFCMARMGAGVGRDLRRDVFRKVTYFNNTEMDEFSGASLITRSTNDVVQIQNFLSMGFRMMCFAPIMGIGGMIMGVSKSLNLAWVLALALVVMLGLILIMFSLVMPRFKKMQSLIDRLNLVSREELSGLMVVRAFSNQPFMQRRFEKANRELTDNTLFVSRAMVTMMPVMTLIMNVLSLLIVWFGGKQIAQSNLQVGDMMAFIQYAMQVIMSFLVISMMFIMVPRASVSAERIYEVLSTKNTVEDAENPTEIKTPVQGVVEFKNVSFRYEGADENVLENISFTARPGQTTAFIGATGSGKSTLVNLIPRFYDASEGCITVDGVDVRELRQKQLREAIGYVPQKGLLFSGTVASNLRYGNEQASDAQLKESTQVAQASEFIQALEKGMDTSISQGGTNVSGGQRQRLSIARALVKKAPIYIFDDTFSALDFKTDAKLRAALKGYTEHATVFIVAQRVSTIMHADQILVLDEGKVVGKGTHEELLKNCATYREIAESQLSKEELA